MKITSMPILAALAGALAAVLPSPARADAPVELSATYTADLAATVSGGFDRKARYLDNLDLVADADLDRLIGWDGAVLHVDVLNNMGKRPNDSAGTLQGVDNIEVGEAALRLFEAWIEQKIGNASLRAGLYDLNSEFYANDAAGLLIAPPFGIGSEFAATGPNGPSIFPSTALGARLRLPLGESGFAQFAAINAKGSTLGDDDGVDFSFDDGLLLVGEAGHSGEVLHASAGVWAYTEKREDIFETDLAGDPLRHRAWGAYGVLDARMAQWGERELRGFLRAGFSRGQTTPFAHGAQAGVLLAPVFATREDSAFSLGAHYARISSHFRDSLRAAGETAAPSEYALEATYSDRVLPFLLVQPDIQMIVNPGGIDNAPTAVVATLRLTIEL